MTNSLAAELEFEFAFGLDAGNDRETNEDRVVCCPELGIFAVIDGMGGLAAGEQAAIWLEQVLPPCMRRMIDSLPEGCSIEHAAEEFTLQLQDLSDSLYRRTNDGGPIHYGAAFCAIWLVRRVVILVHMGDCRAYWMRHYSDTVYALTEDHNVAAQLIGAGALKPADARGHVSGAQLTRFLGMRAPGKPEMTCRRLNEGDRLLLCSDGLYREFTNPELAFVLRANGSNQEKCDRLIALAKERGGRDNISIVLLSF